MANKFPFESLYSIQGVLLVPFVSVGLMLFLLGFYILLFGLVVYFLCVRQTNTKRRLHLWWMTMLFVLSLSSALLKTGQIINSAVLGFQAATTQDIGPLVEWETTNVANIVLEDIPRIIYVLANCIADAILLYRCFVLWNSARWILIATMVVLFLTNAFGMIESVVRSAASSSVSMWKATSNLNTAYLITNAVNNFLLTLIIAGRIWWLSREPRKLMGHEVDGRYKNVVAMVVESGFLYSASLVVEVSATQSFSNLGFGLDLSPVTALMVGIAPTLIILRSSLGLSESAVPNSRMLSTLRFGEPPAAVEAGQHSEVRTVNLQQGSVGSSGNLEACKGDVNKA